MSRKSRSLVKVSGISLALMFMMSGCGIKDMSDSQMKVIANYAADVLIRYDASYYEKFAGENKKNQSQEEDNIVADNETVVPEITTEPAVVTETPQAEETVQADAQATPDNTVVQQGNVADNDVSPMDLFTHLAITTVQEQPTAFDLDKVMEQLEDRSTLARPVGWSKAYEIIMLKDAIEIVKGGGVE